MTRKTRLFLLIALLIVTFLILFFYFRNHRNHNTLVLYGNVDVRQVEISFRVPGQVEELYFQEGDLVPQGALMATLNHSPYVSQVSQAEESLRALSTTLSNAELLYKRRESLIGDQAVSQEDLENSTTNYKTLVANVASAKAALTIAQENLSYTKAYAPTEGVLLTRIREPGTVVNASDPIYTLSISSPVWIRAFVSEPDLGRIAYGMKACISTDTKDAPTYIGTIGFISPVAEFTPKTVQTTELRTDLVYRLRIYVDAPDQRLKQGMPVTITINHSEEK